jgi:hypothetical protein
VLLETQGETMKPITKAEVEEGLSNRESWGVLQKQAFDLIEKGRALVGQSWLLVGYEIARARAEKGEEL